MGAPLKDLAEGIVKPVANLIDSLHTSDAEKAQAMIRLREIEADIEKQLIAAQKEVVVAEAGGNWLQRSWRPLLMLEVVFIVGWNFIIVPLLNALGLNIVVLELPEQLWTLMTVGMGGYVIGRTAEKTVPKVASAIKR